MSAGRAGRGRRAPFAFVGVAMLAPLFVPAASAQAASGSLTVTTLGRHGAKVATTVTVVNASSGERRTVKSGKKLSLPSGKYLAMTDIYESATDGLGTDTIGAQVVTVSGAKSVTLDARKGKAVKVSLDTPADVTGPARISAQVCAGNMDMPSAYSAGGWNDAGALYAIPNSSKLLQFAYMAQWSGNDSYVAVKRTTGIPAAPGGSFKRSQLATLRFSVRSGTQMGSQLDTAVQAAPKVDDCTTDLYAEVRDESGPYSATVHVTPGTWQPDNGVIADNGDGVGGGSPATRTLKTGQSFTQYFGRAAWSPMHYLPLVGENSLTFLPDALIGDPDVGVWGADPTKETVVLSKGSTTVKKQTLTNWGTGDAEFSAAIHGVATYRLTVDAHRYHPGITFPSGMLSSRVTLDWRFKADPAKSAVAPVFMTRFLPAGLDGRNRAKANSTTSVTVSAGRGSQGPDTKFTKTTVKSLKVWTSSDGGTTWKAVSVTRSGSSWKAAVHNPASGAVALRSQVTDSTGGTSTETVYRAYAIG
ncbi:hypothetical protein SAMN05216489_06531 [Streptomyces sp. 3213]|uniref:hypothetical protein n=1 Tax=Streptomyces sp. 3213.3 TaxID=1855348 RepID=UPI0008997F55|nr:hypothetical protein [Streptomyces sp. 3213.3]SEE41580.1 hypothetical protein SAMN05216489_06531 [Streptomyces sp. 3213] [Streptomyces sp. 3213.3]